MVKVMSNIILGWKEEHSCWKARAVIMSELLEMFKHKEMVLLFGVFFENAKHVGIDTEGP